MTNGLDESKKRVTVMQVFFLCGILGSVVVMIFCAWADGGTSVSTGGTAPTSIQTNPYTAGFIASVTFFIFFLGWHIWVDFMEAPQ
jgi:hypothetical protein